MAVVALDIAKGVLAGGLGAVVGGDAGAYTAGTAAIVGHCYPAWAAFRGGRGVSTAGGSVVAVFPAFAPVGAAALLVGVVATRRARVAVWIACGAWVVAAVAWAAGGLPNAWGPAPDVGLVASAVAGAGIVVARFRSAVDDPWREDTQ